MDGRTTLAAGLATWNWGIYCTIMSHVLQHIIKYICRFAVQPDHIISICKKTYEYWIVYIDECNRERDKDKAIMQVFLFKCISMHIYPRTVYEGQTWSTTACISHVFRSIICKWDCRRYCESLYSFLFHIISQIQLWVSCCCSDLKKIGRLALNDIECMAWFETWGVLIRDSDRFTFQKQQELRHSNEHLKLQRSRFAEDVDF